MSIKETSVWSDLWLKEDYWAIWLGFFILFLGGLLLLPNPPDRMEKTIQKANTTMDREAERAPFKTIAYYEAQDIKAGLRARNSDLGHKLAAFFKEPQSWTNNPVNAIYQGQSLVESKNNTAIPDYKKAKADVAMALQEAKSAEAAAQATGFQDQALNETAEAKVDAWHEATGDMSAAKRKTAGKPFNIVPSLLGLMDVMGLFFAVGIKFMGKDLGGFLKGFPLVFAIAVMAYTLANQVAMKHYGIGDAAWAIAIGMLISNTIGCVVFIRLGYWFADLRPWQ